MQSWDSVQRWDSVTPLYLHHRRLQLPAMNAAQAAPSDRFARHVITVHGFMAFPGCMAGLGWHFRRAGFRVSDFRYRSTTKDIEAHVVALVDQITELRTQDRPIDLVAHSMGSVLVRAAMKRLPPEWTGLAVLIAPPNHGTPWARRSGPIGRHLLRCLGGISDASESYVNQLSQATCLDIGVIAGKLDTVIPMRNTFLGDSPHHRIIGTHNSLLVDPRVAKLAIQFLRTGAF